MYDTLRPLLFRLEPERAHALTLRAVQFTGGFAPLRWFVSQLFKAPSKPVEAFGLTFNNPVGLAAGYDKDGVAIRGEHVPGSRVATGRQFPSGRERDDPALGAHSRGDGDGPYVCGFDQYKSSP